MEVVVGAQVGPALRRLRERRGRARVAVARQAGIATETLWRIENGRFQPTAYSVAQVLKALGATDTEGMEVLDLLSPQRAVEVARKIADDRSPALAALVPHAGELVRLLRLRRGWGQDLAAKKIGVSVSRLSRWETGDDAIEPGFAPAIAVALRAAPDEQKQLEASLAILPGMCLPPGDLEGFARLIDDWRDRVFAGADAGSSTLSFLALRSALWRYAVTAGKEETPEVLALLGNALVLHGDWLDRRGRRAEMGPVAQAVLGHLLPRIMTERASSEVPIGEEWWMGAVLHQVRAWRFFPGKGRWVSASNRRSIRLLRSYLGVTSGMQRCALLRDLASVYADEQQFDEAIRLAGEARAEEQRIGNGTDVLGAQNEARVLEDVGWALKDQRLLAHATTVMPALETAGEDACQRVYWSLQWARLMWHAGSFAEARQYLDLFHGYVGQYGFEHVRAEAAELDAVL